MNTGTEPFLRERPSSIASLLARVHETLVVSDPVQPADLIFVLAGRMPRKKYALELYHAGYAPRLLLSVARFEVSKMRGLGFERAGELEELRDRTPPQNRHFFISMSGSDTRIDIPNLPQWNTYGEAIGLRNILEHDGVSRVIVVSSAFHMRRVAFTFRQVFRSSPVSFYYCPVPGHMDGIDSQSWWTGRDERRLVLAEYLKLAGYAVLLRAPHWALRYAMKLKS